MGWPVLHRRSKKSEWILHPRGHKESNRLQKEGQVVQEPGVRKIDWAATQQEIIHRSQPGCFIQPKTLLLSLRRLIIPSKNL